MPLHIIRMPLRIMRNLDCALALGSSRQELLLPRLPSMVAGES
jgi:hypothetical protein